MTKREYCVNNKPVAYHNYYRMYVHGIEYGIEDYVYISRQYQKRYCGEMNTMYHKVKVNYDTDGNAYVVVNARKFNGKRDRMTLYLADFIREGSCLTV